MVAQRDADPGPASAADPRSAPAAPATPSAPVAAPAPPAADPPPATSRTASKPAAVAAPQAAKPAALPAVRGAPPMVSPTAVSKRSGAIPAIKVDGAIGDSANVTVVLCIDEQGAVSSVKVLKAPAEIAGELQHTLQSWRYQPYVNPAGVQSAACFPVSFRVVLKN
jgi:hypothetical protein